MSFLRCPEDVLKTPVSAGRSLKFYLNVLFHCFLLFLIFLSIGFFDGHVSELLGEC